MTTPRVKKVLQQSIGDVLKHRDYQKQSNLYSRASGDLTHMIDVQFGRWSPEFTLNCGIYVPGVTSQFWNTPEPARPKVTDCCISARVGLLAPSRLDRWWEVTDGDDGEKDARIVTDVRSTVTDLALPFVERFETVRDVVQFLSEEPTGSAKFVEPRAPATRLVYAGVLWRKLGDEVRSRTCLDEAIRRAEKTPLETVVKAFVARFPGSSERP